MGLALSNFELVTVMFELCRGDLRVPMEAQAFDVLAYLVLHRDRLVSKEELMAQGVAQGLGKVRLIGG